MFTGLVEEVGTIESLVRKGSSLKIVISCKTVLDDIRLGDSIAVDGTCLTVTDFNDDNFSADIITGTTRSTKFTSVAKGYRVNLERALLPTTRMGGHFVSGHIDKVSKVLRVLRENNAIIYHIQIDKEDLKYLIPKGSIAVDGTSLTIFKLEHHYFEIHLIPKTQGDTKLTLLKPGDFVHLEFDMVGKYILRSDQYV